jgi:hypothetical protein
MSPSQLTLTVSEVCTAGVQCSDGSPLLTGGVGNEKQCRLCGKVFEDDPTQIQDLWIACDNKQCNH